MRLNALSVAAVLVCLPAPAAARQAAGPQERSTVGDAVHWCVFNRPCNWTGHAAIAAGVVWGLRRVDVRPEYAAVVAALVFVGKEVRDHRKWGHVLGTPDSMGDLLSGVAGAYVGYRLFGETRRTSLVVTPDRGTTVGVRIRMN